MRTTKTDLTRRALFATAAATAVLAACSKAEAEPIGETQYGKVRGAMKDGVYNFKGVRYGATTAPPNRFLPPKPPEPWTDVKDALAYGSNAPQGQGSEGGRLNRSVSNNPPVSEDCLFLNLWTKGLKDGKKRPVMVWLHGGGFITGSGSRLDNDGTRLCNRGDVVIVTLNHRLNIFGYTYLNEIGGPDFANAANVGNQDIVQALKWVRDNIANFGGDPANVTIFGVSGGGNKVNCLLNMPSAQGLFHKAAVQSGSLLTTQTRENGTATAKRVMKDAGLREDQIAEFRALPMETLIASLRRPDYDTEAVVDGQELPRQLYEPDAPEISKNIPLLVGTCRDEQNTLLMTRNDYFGVTFETLEPILQNFLDGGTVDGSKMVKLKPGLTAKTLIADWRQRYPEATAPQVLALITTAIRFRIRAILQAERKAAQGGAPAFMYLSTWESPVDGGKFGAYHGSDTFLIFDNVAIASSAVDTDVAGAQKTADAMSTAWLNFAKTGDPGWKPYDTATRTTMVFGPSSQVVDNPRPEERAMFPEKPVSPIPTLMKLAPNAKPVGD